MSHKEPLVIKKKKEKSFKDIVMEKLPDGGNLNACLTCGTCAAGCPATGMVGMDPRKVVRMAALGMDEELKKTPWAWMCSMCGRCVHACPMNVNIPGLVSICGNPGPGNSGPAALCVPAMPP